MAYVRVSVDMCSAVCNHAATIPVVGCAMLQAMDRVWELLSAEQRAALLLVQARLVIDPSYLENTHLERVSDPLTDNTEPEDV